MFLSRLNGQFGRYPSQSRNQGPFRCATLPSRHENPSLLERTRLGSNSNNVSTPQSSSFFLRDLLRCYLQGILERAYVTHFGVTNS